MRLSILLCCAAVACTPGRSDHDAAVTASAVPSAGQESRAATPSQTCAILSEYADGGWQSRVVTGPGLEQVGSWLAEFEARPPLPEGASGKPLAWLHFGELFEGSAAPVH